ncbi:MAG: oxidoreductase [Bacteroidota bacterium]
MANKTALLLGATGMIGSIVMDLLLQDDRYDRVVAFSRRELPLSHPKLQLEIVDFQKMATHGEAFTGDDLFCCLGTTMKKAGSEEAFRFVDYEIPLEAAKIAQSQGLKHYLIITAMGADVKSFFFYNRVKGEIERDLSELALPKLSILQPGLLLGERNEQRLGESIAQQVSKVFSPLLPNNYKPISGQSVASAMVKIANQESEQLRFSSGELQALGK